MRVRWALVVLLVVSRAALAKDDESRLLRFPTLHEDRVVFGYGGDLYTAPVQGGVARRLTSDEGYEMFPRFSPDGKHLAFTGQYDGNTEVYVMPSEGGEPKRLTYTATLGRDDVSDRMGPNNIVLTWTPDGKRIVFRCRAQEFNTFKGRLMTVGLEGDLPEQIPLPRGGFCSFSPDGKKLAYNRIFREFRTWKRYRGGMADEVWIHDFEKKTTEKLTDSPASDLFPMWVDRRIYFLSDREPSGRMNLYVRDLDIKEDRRLTEFVDYDVKFPSLAKGAIVFENGGYLYRFDLQTEKAEKIPVRILEDKALTRGELVSVVERIADFGIGPDGKRAVYGARGDVFTVPAESGPTRNLTATPGVHDRDPRWSPDGKWIAAISDKTGENELWLFPAKGAGEAVQLTFGADTYYYGPKWSPDSQRLLWSDKKQRLRFVDVESRQVTQVAQAKAFEIQRFHWSPDSTWIAYAQPEDEVLAKVYLYSVDEKKTIAATDGWYESGDPQFSADGKYLFFVSARDFNPIYSQTEWNHAYRNMERIYLLALSKKTPSPFRPASDEVRVQDESKPAGEKKSEAAEKKDAKKDDAKDKPKVEVDADGLQARIVALPIKPASYGGLAATGDRLYYFRSEGSGGATLAVYDLKKKKEVEIGRFDGYDLSADGKKMLLKQKDSYAIVDAPAGPVELKDKLHLSGLEVRLDRRAEWAQIFDECWRQMRDFFYAPNLHGVDWNDVRKRYAPMAAAAGHRADLTYVIGEMIGELNAGHTYVGGGEVPAARRIPLGLLGAVVVRDPGSRYYKIEKILPGENWQKATRSPLTEIGVDVRPGEYILAINGAPTQSMDNFYAALVNAAGKQTTLRVNAEPKEEGARDVVVVPTDDEHELYYLDWVRTNIEKVNKASGGKVGYLHIPDMQVPGLNEFAKYFYPQLRKKALIIDVRGNGGGNVSPMIIERLRREIAMFNVARNTSVSTNPGGMHYGPKVMLIDEYSASDGDLVAYRFRKHKIGPIIGKRSWGGVVGIRGTLPLLDGGTLHRPEFAKFDVEGKEWIIEGKGVEPDIVVDNDPAREFAGVDDQLKKAIEVALERLKTEGKEIPSPPPYPVK